MRIINNIELFNNGFRVTFKDGTHKNYITGKRSDIYLRRNPKGLIWTEPRQSFDAAASSVIRENYIIRSERVTK